MSPRKHPFIWGFLFLTGAGGAAMWWHLRPAPEPQVREVPRNGGLDITLLAASDLHFGSTIVDWNAKGKESWVDATPVRRIMDGQMKRIAGKAYPPAIGGHVDPPAALVITGDLTENGLPGEWEQFATFYGLQPGVPEPRPTSPHPGPADRLPVFECIGNHDCHTGSYVTRRVAERHGGEHYTIDYGDLHLASLGMGPDDQGLTWLKRDLAATGRHRPVILFMHYPLAGPYSGGWWDGHADLKDRFARLLDGFNIIAILHGHYHVPGCYKWHNIDVYNIGSIKHGARCFGVIHVTDRFFTFASWNAQQDGWWWWHSKLINRDPADAGKEILDTQVKHGTRSRPAIPYPTEMK